MIWFIGWKKRNKLKDKHNLVLVVLNFYKGSFQIKNRNELFYENKPLKITAYKS